MKTFSGQHTSCYANAKASSNHEMSKCVGLPSMRQSITHKKGCGQAEHSGILDGNRKVQHDKNGSMLLQCVISNKEVAGRGSTNSSDLQ